jgi:hypothetical protein
MRALLLVAVVALAIVAAGCAASLPGLVVLAAVAVMVPAAFVLGTAALARPVVVIVAVLTAICVLVASVVVSL